MPIRQALNKAWLRSRLGEDRRVVGDAGGWGDFGGGVGKLGWETGLSKAYPRLIFKPWISP